MSYKISFCELQHLILWGYNVSKHTWVSVFFMFIFWTSGFALWAAEMRWPTTVLNKHRYKILEANIGWHLLLWVTLKIHFMIGSLQFQFHFHWNFKAYFSLTGIQDKGTSLTFSSCAHSPHMHYHTINKQLISWKGKKKWFFSRTSRWNHSPMLTWVTEVSLSPSDFRECRAMTWVGLSCQLCGMLWNVTLRCATFVSVVEHLF